MSPNNEPTSSTSKPRKRPRSMKYLGTRPRLFISIVAATAIGFLLPTELQFSARILCIWDVGMFCFLGITWLLMSHTPPKMVRQKSQEEDVGRLIILTFVMASATFSITAIAFLLKDTKTTTGLVLASHVLLAICTIVGAWLLVHTIFALHYARSYYKDGHLSLKACQLQKLNFPNELEPDYWDFLYFSLVIGMTSQVSDVTIVSRQIRRLSLYHSVLSFFFNTAIVAMSINIIAGII